MIDIVPPAFIFILGAILIPFLRERRLRQVFSTPYSSDSLYRPPLYALKAPNWGL